MTVTKTISRFVLAHLYELEATGVKLILVVI